MPANSATLHWTPPPPVDSAAVQHLAAELGVARFVAELLVRRGIADPAAADRFLYPRLKLLGDPFAIAEMDAAATRIQLALDRKERIVLYGDYDADGVTALALLARILRALGGEPYCFLPSRADEGYGLGAEGVARCVKTLSPELLIAVDCGTSSVAEIAALQAAGVEVIVLDHHEAKEELPKCAALVNPKLRRGECAYLCSVGLAFKVAHALLKRRPAPHIDLREYLDLVALGSVADLVPLIEENRAFVRRGLAQFQNTKWVGLQALIGVAGLRPPLTPANIGFGLAPRLNASGRLGTAEEALELLLTDDPARAETLAAALDAQNKERRAVEDGILQEALARLAQTFVPERDAAIVLGSAGWHPGVVGIVASRLQKRFHRPALVIAFDETGMGKGSGRSIPGLSLVAALARCGHLLERHGGHEMAAGLTLQQLRFEEFQQAFHACARELLTEDQLQPRQHLDAELRLSEIDFELLGSHEALQPFGMGNAQPVFFARSVSVPFEPRRMKEKHLSLLLRQGRNEQRAIWFNGAAEDLPPPPWDVAFTIERNEWQGSVSAQIHVKNVRAAQA